jgi:hypothetical protein
MASNVGSKTTIGATDRGDALTEPIVRLLGIQCFALPDIAVNFGTPEAGQRAGDVPKTTPTAALTAYYSTVLHGLALQSRDGASGKTLMQVIDFAMANWQMIAGDH